MAVNKVAFEFNPFTRTGIEVPKNKQEEAKREVAEYVKEQILSFVGEGQSPVKSGAWKRSLSPGYKPRKAEESSSNFANLELSGQMLDDLEVIEKRGQKLSLQIEGASAGKADGNNRGSYGKNPDRSKAREFIPKGNQTFRQEIWQGIEAILKRYQEED